MKGCSVLLLGFCAIALACGGRTELDNGPLVTDSGSGDVVDSGPQKLKTSNKLDMVFAIDNSSSMGDKQSLLGLAVPSLLARLTAPWCVPSSDPNGVAIPPGSGQCPSGYTPEFPALNDIHIGIVSSSLGGGGATDVCTVQSNDPTHQDDKGHLLNRTRGNPEGTINAAKPSSRGCLRTPNRTSRRRRACRRSSPISRSS
jgi:hypothetical protein